MPGILYSVSPIGLGHATRSVAVAKELRSLGAEPVFATGGPAADYIRSCGFEVADIIEGPVPNVKEGEMKNASLWYLAYRRAYGRNKKRVGSLMAKLDPTLVVGDEEFATVMVAIEENRKNAMVADELTLGFARSSVARFIESRVERWYEGLQQRVGALIVPDVGQDSGNRHYVSPIVREVELDRAHLLARYMVPAGRKVVLFSMSGSGIGETFLDATLRAFREMNRGDAVLVIAGNRGAKKTGEDVLDVGVVRDGNELVAAADLVVSTAGKSTIDEARAYGVPIIALPIRNHFEQEANARALGYSYEDITKLGSLMKEKIGTHPEPIAHDGARNAARLLLEMAER